MIEQEKRFLELTKLNTDLEVYPCQENLQQKTTSQKNKSFGQVFTPISLVDKMLEKYKDWEDLDKTFLDLCAGTGQFGIRIIRKKLTLNSNLDVEKFIKEKLFFTELQMSSCLKLLYIFGSNLNLFIGDSRELESLPENAFGIWFHNGTAWEDVTNVLQKFYVILNPSIDFEATGNKLEQILNPTINSKNNKAINTNKTKSKPKPKSKTKTKLKAKVKPKVKITPAQLQTDITGCTFIIKENTNGNFGMSGFGINIGGNDRNNKFRFVIQNVKGQDIYVSDETTAKELGIAARGRGDYDKNCFWKSNFIQINDNELILSSAISRRINWHKI